MSWLRIPEIVNFGWDTAVSRRMSGMGQVALPRVGERQAPGGPVEQRGLEIPLQFVHALHDDGWRDVQVARGCGEVAGIGGRDERLYLQQHVHFLRRGVR